MVRSRILTKTFIIITALAVGILASTFLTTGGEKQIEEGLIFGFDAGISEGKIVNGEKGWFALKMEADGEADSFKVYDRAGNILLDTGLTLTGNQKGRFLPMGDADGQWYLLDTQRLVLMETDLTELVIHSSGEYMAGRREKDGRLIWAVERTKNGELLWEGDQEVTLVSQQWYAIAHGNEDLGTHDRIINLRTGQAEYTAKDWETIVEGGLGFWEVDCQIVWDYVGTEETFFCTYLLDENYELAFDGLLFGNVYLNGDYLCGTYREGHYLADFEKLKYERYGYSPTQFIWNSKFQPLYESRPGAPVDILGIRGNVAAVLDDRERYVYWTLSEEGITETRKSGDMLAYLDEEDGIMRVCRQTRDNYHRLRLTSVPERENSDVSRYPEDYSWGYVDRNMEKLLAVRWDSVSESEGGYGIVTNHLGRKAVVDLRALS